MLATLTILAFVIPRLAFDFTASKTTRALAAMITGILRPLCS